MRTGIYRKFSKKDIVNLNYGIMHSQIGYADGVSIVIKQMEQVMRENMGVSKKQIYCLVGKAKKNHFQTKQEKILWDGHSINKMMLRFYSKGYDKDQKEKIEKTVSKAKDVIECFIKENKIDVIIAHNMAHPINFIFALALSRYYKEAIEKKEKTPKYLLWWHDSYFKRKELCNPARDVNRYLLEGVPGKFVEYILFINSLEFPLAEKRYFSILDKKFPGYLELMRLYHDVVYNTTDKIIDSYEELKGEKIKKRTNKFLRIFEVRKLLKNSNQRIENTFFVLQHTRIIPRKRIDFALKFVFELHNLLREEGKYTALYFFISGTTGYKNKKTRAELKKLYQILCERYNTDKVFLVFGAEQENHNQFNFHEIPSVFASLNGISTYFSEIEGFGNNLLEVMASGLIPVVYTYPVFKKDLAKFPFKIITLNKFKISKKGLIETLEVSSDEEKRKRWVEINLNILGQEFQHKIIASKLKRAIVKPRIHL